MKNATLTLVMMAGLPGAGKSTLAKALEREFGWQVIDKDEHRRTLLEQGMDADKASELAYERAFKELREALLVQHISAIFDSAALHSFILDAINEIVRSTTDIQIKVIICVVDRDLRNERLRIRNDPYTRNPVEPPTTADYLEYFKHLPQPPDSLILFTNSSSEECLLKAKQYIMN